MQLKEIAHYVCERGEQKMNRTTYKNYRDQAINLCNAISRSKKYSVMYASCEESTTITISHIESSPFSQYVSTPYTTLIRRDIHTEQDWLQIANTLYKFLN